MTSFAITAQRDFDVESPEPFPLHVESSDLKVDVSYLQAEDNPLQRQCELSINLSDPTNKRVPYTFSLTLIGFFSIEDGWPENKRELLFQANAPALLYSAARELITLISGRGPYPAVLLPSVTFVPSVALPQQDQSGERKGRARAITKENQALSRDRQKDKGKGIKKLGNR